MQDETQSFTSSECTDFPMMSEQEAQQMIQIYKQTIQDMQRQNNTLQCKLDAQEQQFQEIDTRHTNITSKLKKEVNRQEDLKKQESMFNERADKLVENEHLRNYKDFIQTKLLTDQDKQDKEDNLLIRFDQLQKEEQKQEERVNSSLVQLILNQIEMIVEQRRKQAQPTQCLQCRLYYNPKLNEQDSCHYHPGKMKFYSCKNCGADDYFTCCLKCSKCCDGCKFNFHTPKP